VEGSVALADDELRKNGNTPFNVETDSPDPIVLEGAPDCPNSNWVEYLLFKEALIAVNQPYPTNKVLEVKCEFERPTKGGDFAKADVLSCFQKQFRHLR